MKTLVVSTILVGLVASVAFAQTPARDVLPPYVRVDALYDGAAVAVGQRIGGTVTDPSGVAEVRVALTMLRTGTDGPVAGPRVVMDGERVAELWLPTDTTGAPAAIVPAVLYDATTHRWSTRDPIFAPGTWLIEVYARDTVGNETRARRTITVR